MGVYAPPNLVHVVLDNASHDSTGGQPTVSPVVDFAAVALATGYAHAHAADDLNGFAAALKESGATSVAAYVTHGVLSGGAVSRVTSSPLEKMIITDSILATEAVRVSGNIEQLSIAPLIAEAIRRISEESSVSSLFD